MGPISEERGAYIAASFALLFILILCIASFVIVRPFLAALLWGVILAIATWPVFAWFRRRLGGQNTLAAVLMTLLLAVVLLGPVVLVGTTMSGSVGVLSEKARGFMEAGLPPPPAFLEHLPLIGERLTERWTAFAEQGANSTEARALLQKAITWLLAVAAGLSGGIAQLALSIVCAR
jgi:predicted PurR-regulated permease PerM